MRNEDSRTARSWRETVTAAVRGIFRRPTGPASRVAFLLLLGCGVAGTAAAQTVEIIPPSGRWVTDLAGVLSDVEERTLSEKLRFYADSTSTQIVVVTLPTLDGVPASEYAVTLGREWGVGQQGHDNGVVILVSRDDREVFIATGYGLEGAIPDAVASRIVRNVLVPSFREGSFYAGLSRAIDHLVEAAHGEFTAAEAPRSGGPAFDAATVLILLIFAYFVLSAIRQGRRGGGTGGRRIRGSRYGPPVIIFGGGGLGRRSGGFGGGGFGGGGFGGGGFSGGGGSFGGGGAGGRW